MMFSRLKCKKIAAADLITKNSRNDVLKIFRGFKVGKRLMFRRAKKSMKDKCYAFSRYKQTNKVLFLYFQCKRQEDRYG